MVVCITQPCGGISFESEFETVEQEKESSTQLLVKEIRPNFHCSGRPANLDVVRYKVHPTLAALWGEAEEWHLLASDHCDVYGFNLWSPAWLDESTDMVFNGSDGREKWLKKNTNRVINKRGHASRLMSCASKGWVCCLAFSDFDYLSICLDHKRVEYGNVHHINIRHEVETYCCTMEQLLSHLAHFIKEGKEKKTEGAGNVSEKQHKATTRTDQAA